MIRRISFCVLLVAIATPYCAFASSLDEASRLALIRGLVAEYATVKVPLPRGKKGLVLRSDGKVDQSSLRHEITQNGTAFPPNVLVQITALTFKKKQIIFEINGGGKRKTKWYDHVQVGIGMGGVGPGYGGPVYGPNTGPVYGPDTGGPGTGPVYAPDTVPQTVPIHPGNTTTPTGSYVSLVFPQNLRDMTVTSVKNYLKPVLDFNPTSPIQAISRRLPPKFQKAIRAKKAVVGMDRDMVIAAIGKPDRKVRETKAGVETEDWIYVNPPLKVTFVTFEGNEVVKVKEYNGGIGGQVESQTDTDPRYSGG